MAEKNESTKQLWKIQKMKYECEWKKWLMSQEKRPMNDILIDFHSCRVWNQLVRKKMLFQKLMKLLRFDESFLKSLQCFRNWKEKNDWCWLYANEQNNIDVIVWRAELDINRIFMIEINWILLRSRLCCGVKIVIEFFRSPLTYCDVNTLWVSHSW